MTYVMRLEEDLKYETRLDDSKRADKMLGVIDGLIQAFDETEDGPFVIRGSRQFIVRKPAHCYYRLLTQLTFCNHRMFENKKVSFYVEDQETKVLLPIVRIRPFEGPKATHLVWIRKTTCEPVPMRSSASLYVSDEPYVAGMTLKELDASYG